MRDKEASHAEVTPSVVRATWVFLAFLALLCAPAAAIAFPDNRPVGAAVLLAAVTVGAATGAVFPARGRPDAKRPDVWATSGIALGFSGTALATGNGLFAMACAMAALISYYATINFNTMRFHRAHGIREPVAEPEEQITDEELLHRVVSETFGAGIQSEFSSPTQFKHRVHLTDIESSRTAALETAGAWLELRLPDLGVSRLEDDFDSSDKGAVLHDLALVASAYLRGEGRVGQSWTPFGRRPIYAVIIGHRQWELGTSRSKVWDA